MDDTIKAVKAIICFNMLLYLIIYTMLKNRTNI